MSAQFTTLFYPLLDIKNHIRTRKLIFTSYRCLYLRASFNFLKSCESISNTLNFNALKLFLIKFYAKIILFYDLL